MEGGNTRAMVLLDRRIFLGGIALLVAGMAVAAATSERPAGREGMTEEEIVDLLVAEDRNQAYQMLSGILVGVGFLLILVSFGARRKRRGGKKIEQRPEQ